VTANDFTASLSGNGSGEGPVKRRRRKGPYIPRPFAGGTSTLGGDGWPTLPSFVSWHEAFKSLEGTASAF